MRNITLPDHRARKRFGQNFLINDAIIEKIIKHINPQANDLIIEIGPGLGAITERLLDFCPSVTAIEMDRDLAKHLRQKFPNLNLIESDALKTDFLSLITNSEGKTVKIVGNLPYNISTPLIFHLLNFKGSINEMYFMLQKEVIERMAAPPGNKTYGRLSIMVQYSCKVLPLFDISPHAFQPQPKVNSTFAAILPENHPFSTKDIKFFETIVNLAFQQRRKTLRNSLEPILPKTIPEVIKNFLNQRAEQLSVKDFVDLSNHLITFSSHPSI